MKFLMGLRKTTKISVRILDVPAELEAGTSEIHVRHVTD
jgi:hypothetical protein